METSDIIKTIITALITGSVTLGGAFWSFKGKKSESDANVSKAYIDGNNALFNNLQAEINRLTGEMAVLRKELEDAKKGYEVKIIELTKENDNLRNKLRDVIAENKILKGECNHEN